MEKKKSTLLHYATRRDTSDNQNMSTIRKSLSSARRGCATHTNQTFKK